MINASEGDRLDCTSLYSSGTRDLGLQQP